MKNLFIVFVFIIGSLTIETLKAQTGWVQQTNPLSANSLGKIQFISSTEGWISEGSGKLLHTTNAGANWTVVTPFPTDTVASISYPSITMWWVNQTHGWKINWSGTNLSEVNAHGAVIHKTTDGGITWQKKVLTTTAGDAGIQIQFVDENNGWASILNFSTGNSSIMRSTDGGNNWSQVSATGMEFGIIYFVDLNNGWFINGGPNQLPTNKIQRTTNGGANWSVQYSEFTQGKNFQHIQFTDLNNGWVVGDSNKILKTTNGGNNWTYITNTGISSDAKTRCVFFLDANTGWIGTNIPNPLGGNMSAILYTNNGGSSWTLQNPQINGSIFSIFFRDANNGWFAGETCNPNCNGTIGHTTNGGVTGVVKDKNTIPMEFSLEQNYPNPFNPSTTIKYTVPFESHINIKFYNSPGQCVCEVIEGTRKAGYYEVNFNASGLASGVYFYSINAVSSDGRNNFRAVKKMMLIK